MPKPQTPKMLPINYSQIEKKYYDLHKKYGAYEPTLFDLRAKNEAFEEIIFNASEINIQKEETLQALVNLLGTYFMENSREKAIENIKKSLEKIKKEIIESDSFEKATINFTAKKGAIFHPGEDKETNLESAKTSVNIDKLLTDNKYKISLIVTTSNAANPAAHKKIRVFSNTQLPIGTFHDDASFIHYENQAVLAKKNIKLDSFDYLSLLED